MFFFRADTRREQGCGHDGKQGLQERHPSTGVGPQANADANGGLAQQGPTHTDAQAHQRTSSGQCPKRSLARTAKAHEVYQLHTMTGIVLRSFFGR